MKLYEQNWTLKKILDAIRMDYDILDGTDHSQLAKWYGEHR